MHDLKILYISKLRNSKANGVTVAVTQLLNSMCEYSQIGWLDLGETPFDMDLRIKKLSFQDWESFKCDIAVFEDPFDSLKFCSISHKLKRKRIPYIVVPHGCFNKIAMKKSHLKKVLAIRTVFSSFLNGSFATQYLCENEKVNSLHFGNSIIIPNGISKATKDKEVEEIKNIIFLSRKNVKTKGIDYLLEALTLKQDLLRKKAIKVDLYGSIESEDDEIFINDYIESKGLADIVFNNGPVFGEEKTKVLLNSDMFILTSRHEGFPMSILEALSFGLPVLITKGTNVDDIIENANAGWTCTTDSTAIADKIEEALMCADCLQVSKNARKLSLDYSWDAIAQMTVKEYSRIVGEMRKNNG